MESLAEKILDCEEIKPGVYKCCFVSLERLREACQRYTKEEEKLSKRIFADVDYDDAIKRTALHEKMKKIISEHGPFTAAEIDVFVEENLDRPVLEEIFNDFKVNKDIRNSMKKYGVATVNPIMPHLIYLEFFAVNENLVEEM